MCTRACVYMCIRVQAHMRICAYAYMCICACGDGGCVYVLKKMLTSTTPFSRGLRASLQNCFVHRCSSLMYGQSSSLTGPTPLAASSRRRAEKQTYAFKCWRILPVAEKLSEKRKYGKYNSTSLQSAIQFPTQTNVHAASLSNCSVITGTTPKKKRRRMQINNIKISYSCKKLLLAQSANVYLWPSPP
mgnify:CR=1 FL=1